MRGFFLVILLALLVVVLLVTRKDKDKKPQMVQQVERYQVARKAAYEMEMREIEKAIDAYQSDTGSLPGDLSALVPHYVRLSSQLIDPWETSLRMEIGGDGRNNRLVSAGPDRQFGTADDLVRSF